MTFVFKHPKYYTELRSMRKNLAQEKPGFKDVVSPINDGKPGARKSDQAISLKAHDGECERAPWSGPQATSFKQQATSAKLQASSFKRQAPEATSHKHQAPSNKRQA
jgi:hypothetical protein